MSYIPDNYDQWLQHDTERENRLKELPRCCECDEPIQQEDALYINGEYICDRCLDDLRVEIMGEAYG